MRLKACISIVVLIVLVSMAGAEENTYPIGWFSAATPGNVARMNWPVSQGSTVMLPTHAPAGSTCALDSYLAQAEETGIKVIVDVRDRGIYEENWTALADFITDYDDNETILAWFIADEPEEAGIPGNTLRTAYQTIKSVSDKPVTLVVQVWTASGTGVNEFDNAYDFLMIDDYPFRNVAGDAEFFPFSNFVSRTQAVASNMQSKGVTFWYVHQAFGRGVGSAMTWRLPTYDEARFATYYSLLEGADGLLWWTFYRTIEETAYSNDPYPYCGKEWLGWPGIVQGWLHIVPDPEKTVWKPLARELNVINKALAGGEYSNGVTANNNDIKAKVYSCGETYFLVAANRSGSAASCTLVFNLDISPRYMVPANDQLQLQDISATPGVSDVMYFDPYEVMVYELTETYCDPENAPVSDLTGDCNVGLEDLQRLTESWLDF